MNIHIKELLYNHCKSYLTSKLSKYQKRNKELYQSLSCEEKSSAGDKHETGRAMIQLEIEKLGNQIKEIELEYDFFLKINNKIISTNISIGSIVVTNKNLFYITISAGVFQNNSKKYYCISPKSPIGCLLIGKKINDSFIFNKEKIEILNIF